MCKCAWYCISKAVRVRGVNVTHFEIAKYSIRFKYRTLRKNQLLHTIISVTPQDLRPQRPGVVVAADAEWARVFLSIATSSESITYEVSTFKATPGIPLFPRIWQKLTHSWQCVMNCCLSCRLYCMFVKMTNRHCNYF